MSSVLHIETQQGDTFKVKITSYDDDVKQTPVDYTGMMVRSQIRKSTNSSTIYKTFTLDVNVNVITLSLTALETSEMQYGAYVYDIEIFDSDIPEDVETLLHGNFIINPEVTK